jgi:hypothetical protein
MSPNTLLCSDSEHIKEHVVGFLKIERVTSEGKTQGILRRFRWNREFQNTGFNLTQFYEFIVHLWEDIYGQQIKLFADHLLNVVRCASDRVMIAVSRGCNGCDLSRMKYVYEHPVKVLKKMFECSEGTVVNSRRNVKAAQKVMFKEYCSGLWGSEAMQCAYLCSLRVGLHVSNMHLCTKICIELTSVATHEEDTALLGNSPSAKTSYFQN